jgi:hypothetical protein
MRHERGGFVHEGETICRITSPFKSEAIVVEAPFTGLLVGVLENPVVYPGNPLCHFVKIDQMQERIIEDQNRIPHK